MKKSTIILIVFVAVMFFIQFSIIFQVKFKVDELADRMENLLIKKDLPEQISTLVLEENNRLHIFNNHNFSYKDNVPKVQLNISDLDSVIIKGNTFLKADDMQLDTLTLVVNASGNVKFDDMHINFLRIKCEDVSNIKIYDLQCQDLEIVASDNAKVKIKGDIDRAFGVLNDNASVKLPSGIQSDFEQSDNASLSFK